MKAIWMIRWRVLSSRFRFWTSIVGYDPRDHSLRQVIYLVYVVIFFSVWGFAFLSLLANLGAGVLYFINASNPPSTSAIILAAVLLSTFFINAYQFLRRSPFNFSNTDAELICQTPVNRSQVAIAWFLGDWIPGGLLFTALAVVMKFAAIQTVEGATIAWSRLPALSIGGVGIGSIAILLDLAFIAIAFSLGALRLRGGADKSWLRLIPLVGSLALMLLLWMNHRAAQFLLWPILYPLRSSFGIFPWFTGFVVAMVLAAGGLLILYWFSSGLNLSRAAQESHFGWAVQQAAFLGDTDLLQDLKRRQRLGIGHAVSRIPARGGLFSLFWKGLVAATRQPQIKNILRWMGIFIMSLVMMASTNWGNQFWAFVVWSLWVAQQCLRSLRADLRVWPLTRQLAFSSQEMIIADCFPPVFLTIIISWLSIFVSSFLGFRLPVFLLLWIPLAVLCVVLSAAYGIFRSTVSTELMSGRVADFGGGGFLLGIISAGLPIAVFRLSTLYAPSATTILFSSLGVAIGICAVIGLFMLSVRAFKRMK